MTDTDCISCIILTYLASPVAEISMSEILLLFPISVASSVYEFLLVIITV